VEAVFVHGKFLLAAYQDGGLISVSGLQLSFQKRAEPADWWAPPHAR
jgi:hypothetical protein